MMLSKSFTAMLLFAVAFAGLHGAASAELANGIFDTVDAETDNLLDLEDVNNNNKDVGGGLRMLTGGNSRGRNRKGRGRSSRNIDLDITNLSFQQPFGPFFVMVHNRNVDPLFTLGMRSSAALADLAENGNPDMLVSMYTNNPDVLYVGRTNAPQAAGGKQTITVPISRRHQYVTIGSMCLNTNDW